MTNIQTSKNAYKGLYCEVFTVKSFVVLLVYFGYPKDYPNTHMIINIKKATNPERKIVKAFDVLNVSNNELGKGLVICMTDRTFPIDENNYMVPASIL